MPVLTDQATCLLCAERDKTTPATTGQLCGGCYTRLADTLTRIPEQMLDAVAWTPPAGHNAGSHTYGSRPPLPVETIDPELALIELNPGDRTSAVPLLEMFEMWERVIREDRQLVPYGPASLARTPIAQTSGTFLGCLRFLHANLDWMVTDPDFDLVEFADHSRRASAILRRWSTDEPVIGTRIACPTQLDDGSSCDATIVVSSDRDGAYCRRCGRTWTIEWLIRVAGEDAEGWADMEAIVRLSGLHERTIRRWASGGKVRKRGLLYSVRDVSERVRCEVSA